jgi:hypothetical protein
VKFAQNSSVAVTAVKFNIHNSTVRNWLKLSKIVTRSGLRQKVNRYDLRLKAQVLHFAKNNSRVDTCSKFGLPMRTLNEWLFRVRENAKLIEERKEESMCHVCDKVFEVDETNAEHVIRVHFTIEGRCDICGEDGEESSDFLKHFKIHNETAQNKSLFLNPFYSPDGLLEVRAAVKGIKDKHESAKDQKFVETLDHNGDVECDRPVEGAGNGQAGQDPKNVAELNNYIQSMLQQMHDRFVLE